MNFKKRMATIIIGLCCITSLVSCGNEEEYTYNEVSCPVIHKEYHPSWIQPINSGKVHTYFRHPAKYYVYVEYADLGLTYKFNNKELYNAVNNNDEVTMYLRITPQSNNSVNVSLVPYNTDNNTEEDTEDE